MKTPLDDDRLFALAEEVSGNWTHFSAFSLDMEGRPDDMDRWAIWHGLDNRDSTLIGQSNAAAIRKRLAPFLMDAPGTNMTEEHFSHWACGWIDAIAVRVYVRGPYKEGFLVLTKAFKAVCEILADLEDYPLLDEEDYSRREYDAALWGIEDCGGRFVKEGTPEDWPSVVYGWLNDEGYDRDLENTDDTGAYPSEEAMKRALAALGFLHPDYAEEEVANVP